MRKIAVSVAALGAIAALALTGCSSNNNNSGTGNTPASTGGDNTPAATATGGTSGDALTLPAFDAGATIGVSLPQKTSENWVLAGQLFTDQLNAAGFKPMVNYANGGVTDQQNQIQAMITAGAKVLVIGAIDGSQLGSQLQAAHDAGMLGIEVHDV